MSPFAHKSLILQIHLTDFEGYKPSVVMGVLMIPTVGDRGSRTPSGVFSTIIGVRLISTDGDRGSNSSMRL